MLNPAATYHYLNLIAFLAGDNSMVLQDRVNINSLLQRAAFPLQTLDNLRKNCPSKVVHSIFLSHLLCRSDLLIQLPGKSLLEIIAQEQENTTHPVKRLRPYTHFVDLSITPEESIQLFTPEAAATLFCSVGHFHQLNEINIPILFSQVGQQGNLLLHYWIKSYATMPNYSHVLTLLAELYPEQVEASIKELSPSQRQNTLLALVNYSATSGTFSNKQRRVISALILHNLQDCKHETHYGENTWLQQQLINQLSIDSTHTPRQKLFTELFWSSLDKTTSKGKIIAFSLQHNTDKLLKTLFTQKSNKTVIEFLSAASEYLTRKTELGVKIKTAKEEALFEEKLTGLNFKRLRRCAYYGWTGFFNPKPPQFARGERLAETTPLRPAFPAQVPSLTECLSTITADSELFSLEALYDALIHYEKQPKGQDELKIRQYVDKLFISLYEKARNQAALNTWLQQTRLEAFVTNRNQLIALYCKQDNQKELTDLLKLAQQGPGVFGVIAKELTYQASPPIAKETAEGSEEATAMESPQRLNQLAQFTQLPTKVFAKLWDYRRGAAFWKTPKTSVTASSVCETNSIALDGP